jgi:hypothetical protein
MRSQVWGGLLTAGVVVAVTSWLAQGIDAPTLAKAVAVVLAAVASAFAPTYVEHLSRERDRLKAAQRTVETEPAKTPAGLLRAHHRVVPFTGRESELAELREWCRGKKSPVRLIVGAGGVGKTRLAVELGEHFSAGWTVATVSPGQEADALIRQREGHPSKPILLIVDYAETRTGVAELLRTVPEESVNVRVLLIARKVGDWWRQLGSDTAAVRQLVDAYLPMELSSTLYDQPTTPEQRAALVREAIPHFARELKIKLPAGMGAVDVQGDVPLLVLHAMALVRVLGLRENGGNDSGASQPSDQHRVLTDLLGHERRYWQQASGAGVDLTVRSRVVAVACLFPARDEDDAAELLRRVPDLRDQPEDGRRTLARWLNQLYPTNSGYWGSLQPELLAERLALEEVRECPALCAETSTLRPEQLRQMLALLSRATGRQPRDQQVLSELLHGDRSTKLWLAAVSVATTSGGGLRPVLHELVFSMPPCSELLEKIDRAIPYPTTQLVATAVVVARRLLLALPPDSDITRTADRLEHLGRLEAQAGQTETARHHIGKAVSSYEALALRDPGRYQPELARCLHLYALRHAELGELATARSLADRAVTLFRDSPTPRDPRPDIAACLHNLGEWTIDEDCDRARTLLTEAQNLYLELAEEDPDRYLGHLYEVTESLRRCGPMPPKRHSGDWLKRVTRKRKQVNHDPDQYKPELAYALRRLGVHYAASREFEQADAPLAEAEQLYRELAQANPDRYRAELAGCLNDRGVALGGRRERFNDAEHPLREAVELFRALDKAHSRRYLPELARALENLVVLLVEIGRHVEGKRRHRRKEARRWIEEQSLPVADEAVRLYQKLAELEQDRYEPELARALTNHGVCLSELSRHVEAEPIARRAVRLYETRYQDLRKEAASQQVRDPDTLRLKLQDYAARLALARENLAVDLDALRNPEADEQRDQARWLRDKWPNGSADNLLGPS